MTGRTASLAGSLYRRVLLLIALVGLAMGASVFWAARGQIRRQADAQLLTAANVLYALMQDELAERHGVDSMFSVDDSLLSGEDLRAFRTSADWRMFTISRGGRQILRSDTAPPSALIPQRRGFQTVETPGGPWRIYGLVIPRERLLIQVGERTAVSDRLIADVAENLVIPISIMIGGTAGLLWLSLVDGLRHVRKLNARLARRMPTDIQRFETDDWPSEIAPLIETLNGLFERVAGTIEQERRFTNDAAHQLRTPLATLKLQAQALQRTTTTQDILAATDSLLATIDRAGLLVSQMLTLARLDAGEVDSDPFDLAATVRTCIADHALTAARRGVAMAFDGTDRSIMIAGPEAALNLAVSNLLENAIKHAPDGSTVTVSLGHDDDQRIVIAVTDEGPGIPPEERARVTRRFYRGDAQHGTGLGLAIVTSALELFGGSLALEDGPGGIGLLARVTIPHIDVSFASG